MPSAVRIGDLVNITMTLEEAKVVMSVLDSVSYDPDNEKAKSISDMVRDVRGELDDVDGMTDKYLFAFDGRLEISPDGVSKDEEHA